MHSRKEILEVGKTCTFFGHRECPVTVKPRLREVVVDLIENHGVGMFYVGRQGSYDAMVRSVLKEMVLVYPYIQYAVVLERMPQKRDPLDDYSDTLLPEGIETVHPRFAISWRNRWMLQQSDYVVAYVTHSWGGAAQFAKIAEKQNKIIRRL